MSCNWQKVRLGDVCEIQTGPFGSQLHNEDYVTVGTPIVTVEHLGQRKFSLQNLPRIKEKDKQRLIKYVLKKDDIVFSRVGSVDRCSYVSANEDGWLFSGRCLRVRCLDKIIYTKYLYYYFCLEKIRQHIRNIAVGATMPSINTKLLQSIEVELPPLAKQERIAAILGSLDDKIELNNRINKNLEEQASALFKHWFVDFEFPDANGKPYKSSGGAFKDSELGPIPSDWRIGTLENIGNIIGGGTPSKANNDYYTAHGIPWITPKDLSLKKLKFISNGETDITDLGYKSSSAKIMPKGSVLFSSRAPIGYISIANNDLCTNQGFKSVVPMKGIGTAFIYLYLKSNVDIIESKASGSTFKEASSSLMKSLDVIIPNQKILDQFNGIGNEHFQQQKTLEAETKILEHLRDSLLPQLMCNKIKLKA